MDPLVLAVLIALGATVFALASGISSMVTNTEVAHRDSAHWMVMRVAFQAIAAILIVAAVLS